MKRKISLSIILIVIMFSHRLAAEVRVPSVFGSNMVLQRDKPVHVWGWATGGEEVVVSMNQRSVKVNAGKDGRWTCFLPAFGAGGPYELTVAGKNTLRFTNVLMGDVWICGGQSNMQWNVAQSNYDEKDSVFIATANLRLFAVQFDMDYKPREDVKSAGWKTLSRQNILEFSAVAYYFGKFVTQEAGVPIGLISDNLGATAAEVWMSNEALMQFPQYAAEIGQTVRNNKSFDQLRADFEKGKDAFYKNYYYKSQGVREQWFKPETSVADWKPIKVSGNTWTEEKELKDFDGEVWFRTTFDLPENFTGDNFTVSLSQIDDYDITWVNGIKIGETFGKHNHRNYTFTASSLKPRGNVLVVRVFDTGGIGGFSTNMFWGNKILWGNWVYKKGEGFDAAHFPKPVLPNATPFSSPSVLYNASIAPLTRFPIKGAIWYQGESNVERASEYRKLFPALITDWRNQWNQGDFPFLFVQLANYMDEPAEPSDHNWAELREAQAMALSLPNTGMASAIDLGEAGDIHPKNKRDVGKRLGLAAMKVAYGKDIVASGPSYAGMKIEGDQVTISYDNIGEGLKTRDKYGYVRGFQIAGEDHKFYWAKASVAGNTVVVSSNEVKHPAAVRYAWAANPGSTDLYNRAGLPALPFRTDAWKGLTDGEIFKDGPRF